MFGGFGHGRLPRQRVAGEPRYRTSAKRPCGVTGRLHRAALGHGGKARIMHPKKQNPGHYVTGVLFFRSLAMTYSHMGKPHTTIGDAPFHC